MLLPLETNINFTYLRFKSCSHNLSTSPFPASYKTKQAISTSKPKSK